MYQVTNYNWYNHHFHVPQFFHLPSKVQVLVFLFTFFLLLCGQLGQERLQICKFSFFLLIIIRFDRLAEIRWSVCISKSQRSLCISFSRTDAWLCIYHLFIWSNFNFLHNSQWITLLIQFCLVLYSFWANLLHSLMWLIVLSLSPCNLHLLFSCILCILALIWLILTVLFCAAIRRDLVSLLKFSFS